MVILVGWLVGSEVGIYRFWNLVGFFCEFLGVCMFYFCERFYFIDDVWEGG